MFSTVMPSSWAMLRHWRRPLKGSVIVVTNGGERQGPRLRVSETSVPGYRLAVRFLPAETRAETTVIMVRTFPESSGFARAQCAWV